MFSSTAKLAQRLRQMLPQRVQKSARVKIFDCFTFFNELELLELRLRELDRHVDHFVLCESNLTHSGKPKPYLFDENKNRFSAYAAKIIHVKWNDTVHSDDAWAHENAQRNALASGFRDVAREQDVILISDIDEIPDLRGVDWNTLGSGFGVFQHTLYYYFLNCRQNQPWMGTVAFVNKKITPQEARNNRTAIKNVLGRGWHFSFLGGKQRIAEKLNAYAETQTNTSNINESAHIEECLRTGKDLFHREDHDSQKQFVDRDGTFPEQIEWFIARYPDFWKRV